MARKLTLAALAAFGVLALVPSAFATSYVRISDGDLARQAAVIAEVRVLAVEPAPLEGMAGRPATDYLVEVDRVLKGFAPGSQILVRVPGGMRPDGTGLHLFGAPRFSAGERSLLFLRPGADGSYRVLHLFLGAFHLLEASPGNFVAVRALGEATEVPTEGGERQSAKQPAQQPVGVRDLEAFRAWLRTAAEGADTYGEYFVLPTSGEQRNLEAGAERFTIFTSEGRQMRWPDFDTGGALTYRAHVDGQPGVTGGGFKDFEAALTAWSVVPGSRVRLNYGGTTTAATGLTSIDGTNAILFEDPNGEIDSPFTCGTGGVLAIGGVHLSGTHRYQGQTFWTVVEGDVVINKDTGCFLNTLRRAEEVYAHEVGHSLAFGHSSDLESLMWPSARGDGRGAALSSDDRAGLCFLYGEVGCAAGEDGTAPEAPGDLAGVALSPTEVRLEWQDNSDDEATFEIERLVGLSFHKVGEVEAGVTTFEIGGLAAGMKEGFRVRARNAFGASRYSNTAQVIMPETPADLPPAAPGRLEVEALSTNSLRLYWEDGSNNETAFRVEASSGGQPFTLLRTVTANQETAVVGGLAEDTVYTLRIQALGDGGASEFSNAAAARTFQEDVSRPSAPEYLLAIPVAAGKVLLRWGGGSGSGPGVAFRVEQREAAEPFKLVQTVQRETGAVGEWLLEGVSAGVDYSFRVRAVEAGQPSAYSPRAYATLVAPGSSCAQDTETSCLLGERFQVQVWWRNQRSDEGGKAGAIPLSDQTSSHWFFGPGVVELIVKVLDGRVLTDHFWVFYGALSDLEYWISVTDTESGFIKSYFNPPGNLCGVPDTTAIPDSLREGPTGASPASQQSLAIPVPSPEASPDGRSGRVETAACTADFETLCLLDGRLQVRVRFAAPNGQSGPGRALADTDKTGFFWFFSPQNIELAVKALDGRPVNGHFWVFWGSLSNVEYEITVTDTLTGVQDRYLNPQSNFCGGADTAAL